GHRGVAREHREEARQAAAREDRQRRLEGNRAARSGARERAEDARHREWRHRSGLRAACGSVEHAPGSEPRSARDPDARRLPGAPSRIAHSREERGAQVMRRLMCSISFGVLAMAVSGCSTATSHFYTLDPTATSDGGPPVHQAIAVGPVSVPPSVDRPQFVVQVAPNRVAVDEFNRWAGPLDDSIGRAIAGDLAVLLGTSDVAVAPVPGFVPTLRVTVDVQRFESVPGESVAVEALWSVRPMAGGDIRSGRTVAREAVQGKSYDAIAAAHSRALATVSSDIAAAIRAHSATPPRRRTH